MARLESVSSYGRISYYRCGARRVQVASSPIFRMPGWERPFPKKRPKLLASGVLTPEQVDASVRCSVARARRCVRDLALNNRFTHFFTWTIDPKRHDSKDIDAVSAYLNRYLRNITYRYGFSYVLVTERHKSGAVHFHGLCKLGTMNIVRAINPHSGLPLSDRAGRPVYNMPGWTWGFSTCVPISGKYERCVNYILKYITKDFAKIMPRRYYSSRDLIRTPDYDYFNPSESFEEWAGVNNAKVFSPYDGLRIATLSLDSDDVGTWERTYNLRSVLDQKERHGMPKVTIIPGSSLDCKYQESVLFARYTGDLDWDTILFSGQYGLTNVVSPLEGTQDVIVDFFN